MRYGHGPGGIFGIMLNEHALCWLERATLFEVDHHKEESPSIIKIDDDYRNAFRDTLEKCVGPL